MRMVILFPLMALAVACGDELGDELGDPAFGDADTGVAASPIEAAAQPLILGQRDWLPLTDFDGLDLDGTIGTYGRATARIGTCSAGLISDDVLVGARHDSCGVSTDAHFGWFGDPSGDFSIADAEARRRLRQIGVPESVVQRLDPSTWRDWTCPTASVEAGRDIRYMRCEPKLLEWDEAHQNSRVHLRFHLKPGHIWGFLEVERGERADRTSLRVLSINRRWSNTPLAILVSGGRVIDRNNACNQDWNHCFEHGADTLGGSSGGPILDTYQARMFGVHSGGYEGLFRTENRASYLGDGVTRYLTEARDGGWPTGAGAGQTPTAGGAGGQRVWRACPQGMMAAGVVGTTSAQGYVGNFGLVCVPHGERTDYRLDRAYVVAGGSWDTGAHEAQNYPLNQYLHEFRSDSQPGRNGTQAMALCPPAFYIRSLTVRAGTYVDNVLSMTCADPQTGALAHRNVTIDPESLIGRSPGGAMQTLACPDGSYAHGIVDRVGALTDAIALLCRYED
ncbi:MAG: hypothetical protein R3F60_20900 [bacterium]